jgi:hypothetical protein
MQQVFQTLALRLKAVILAFAAALSFPCPVVAQNVFLPNEIDSEALTLAGKLTCPPLKCSQK